jgi:multidrug efflux pump subunit AcrA (membrane-fusion protein)
LLLQQRLRACSDVPELGSLLVNDSRLLFPYRTALFWFGGKLSAVSGLPEPVANSPFTRWAEQVCQEINSLAAGQAMVFEPDKISQQLASDWDEYFPVYALWLPLSAVQGGEKAGLLMVRDTPWRNEEQRILDHWGQAAGHALQALVLRKHAWRSARPGSKKHKILIALFLTAVLALWIPVPLTVLAPAEIVPSQPQVIRSPMDGVVKNIKVKPNAMVSQGQLLLQLDEAALTARLDVAQQELDIAQAEHLRAEQASVTNREFSSQLPVLKARIQQRNAEVAYIQGLLQRIAVHATTDGIAIIPDINEMEGRSVAIGQRLLTIAHPDQAELEFWLPVGDSLKFPEQAEVRLYLNIAPEKPLSAVVYRMDFRAQVSPEGILAYRGRARFPGDITLPRIGLRGTAKIIANDAPLYYYLFRRPYSALRQLLGF